ncbi:MAG: hypothetical protein JO213_08910 [Alphaproteobacteria bacterium]|nr:hypothetical protein [Alphaproteobacteria bacterium]MBV9152691.1 hypothetical protein [Alphaproteobacteria bacterium]MBV9584988.1 hypothetical protein [Alphaproteobacteria bacterium]
MIYESDQADRLPPVTIEDLRSRAARYRELMSKVTDPRRVNRYRDLSHLLEKAAEELWRLT